MNDMETGPVAMGNDQKERRKSVLSDADLDKIEQAFDRRLNGLFEMIGYDTTTPESRQNIRKDHEFIRGLRRAKGRIAAAFYTGIGGSVALWFWNVFGRNGHGQ